MEVVSEAHVRGLLPPSAPLGEGCGEGHSADPNMNLMTSLRIRLTIRHLCVKLRTLTLTLSQKERERDVILHLSPRVYTLVFGL
jgi:hypothetical protein